MMLDFLVKVVLSEKEKKTIVILLFIFILLLLLFGLTYAIIEKRFNRVGKKINAEIKEYKIYGIARDEKDLKRIGNVKNKKLFLKQFWLPFLILVLILSGFFIFLAVSKYTFRDVLNVYGDMFFRIETSTVQTFIPFIYIWDKLPTIDTSTVIFHNNVIGYVSYSFLIIFTISFFFVIDAAFKKKARAHQIKKIVQKLYYSDDDMSTWNTIIAPQVQPYTPPLEETIDE